MYRVPAAPELDKRLRRSIWLALLCCSFGSGLLMSTLIELPIRYGEWISLGVYLAMVRGCWVYSAKGSIKGLGALAGLGLILILACLAITTWSLFGFRHLMPAWSRWIMPVNAVGLAPHLARWFVRRVAQRPPQV